MAALARPDVPAGPVLALFDALHDLHHRAGWPSLRDLAREVGCSRTTVAAAFSQPRVPRWGLVELLVEELGGDTARFHQLWLTATSCEVAAGPAAPGTEDTPPAAVPLGQPAPPDAGRRPPAPRQLPPAVADFVGRGTEQAELDRLLLGDREPGVPALAVVTGTGGVGKTSLAVRWAHAAAERFPDGQLHVDLRGYDGAEPLSASAALDHLLRSCGETDLDRSPTVDDKSARFRAHVADRRLLLLLDNACSVEQVRPLLPGSPGCAVLVTSRDRLAGLVARDGARRVEVDALPLGDAVALLARLVGDRVGADPSAAGELARRCDRLPLALRVAAELCAARRGEPVRDVVAELDGQPDRLALLDVGGDAYATVRTVLSWSARHLSADALSALRLLGTSPGPDLSAAAAAALLGVGPGAARGRLDELAAAHLVQPTRGRVVQHDLLRAYAAGLAAELPDAERAAALERLLGHLVAEGTATLGAAACAEPETSDGAAVRGWLDTELPNLVAVAARTTAAPLAADLGRLARGLAPVLDAGAYHDAAEVLYGAAARAARASGDRRTEAQARNLLGALARRTGRYGSARAHHRAALRLARACDDRGAAGTALDGMGCVHWRRGRYAAALRRLRSALGEHQAAGHQGGSAVTLVHLGIVQRRLGDPAGALERHHAALRASRELGDRAGEARALTNAAVVLLELGRHADAADDLHRAVEILRRRGDQGRQALALVNLGAAYQGLGRDHDAVRALEHALLLSRTVGDTVGEAEALRGLGVAASRAGRPAAAVEHLERAVALAVRVGEAAVRTGALRELGDAHLAAGRSRVAAERYTESLQQAERSRDAGAIAAALTGLRRARAVAPVLAVVA